MVYELLRLISLCAVTLSFAQADEFEAFNAFDGVKLKAK